MSAPSGRERPGYAQAPAGGPVGPPTPIGQSDSPRLPGDGAERHRLPRRYAHGSRVPGWDDAVDLAKDPSVVPDPATTPVPAELRATIERYMALYPDRRSAALPALRAAQALHGWCSPETIEQAACVMQATPAYLTSLAGFYDMFETEPVGRHRIYVCTNISCSLRGADALYEAMLDAAGDDADLNVRSFECLGACDIAPMASVDGTYVGPLELDDCRQIVDDLHGGRPVLEHKQLAHRMAAGAERSEVPLSDAAAEQGRGARGPTALTNEPDQPEGI